MCMISVSIIGHLFSNTVISDSDIIVNIDMLSASNTNTQVK